jgi:hypothetical protein
LQNCIKAAWQEGYIEGKRETSKRDDLFSKLFGKP